MEIAGAIAGIRRGRSKYFEQVQQKHIRIILLEALDRLLGGFSGDLSSKGHKALEQLGVEVRLNVKITGISTNGVQTDGGFIETENIIWAAGARAQLFTQSMGFESDKIGRIIVDNYCSVPGHPDVFIIGDTAVYKDGQKTLPSLAPVAIQQGNFVAGIIKSDMSCKARKPFKYKNKGSIAIIGRHRAVLQYGKLKMSGYLAWLIWIILHFFLVSRIRTKGIDAVRLLFHYLNECKGTRLIAGE